MYIIILYMQCNFILQWAKLWKDGNTKQRGSRIWYYGGFNGKGSTRLLCLNTGPLIARTVSEGLVGVALLHAVCQLGRALSLQKPSLVSVSVT